MKTSTTLSRLFATGFLAIGLTLAVACGGGSDDGDGDENPDGGSNPTATPRPSQSSGSITGIDPDTAVVTIGGERFEFDMTSPFGDTCLTLFGVVAGNGHAMDGSDVTIDVEIPPQGFEGDERYEGMELKVEVRDDDTSRDFHAGGDFTVYPDPPASGESQVDSYETDGTSAKGTATFIDTQALVNSSFGNGERPEPVEGTFEIRCG